MDDKRVADYFVIAGLPENPSPLEEFSRDNNTKTSNSLLPITDITVIIRSQGEVVPDGFKCIETTPLGFPADLNHGSLRSPSIYLCYKRGREKPPLVDIGVLYEGKERVMSDSEVVLTTHCGRPANVNNSGSRTFLTYRRAMENAPCNQLVVTDICVILTNKGETPPHAFCRINKNLNKGVMGSDVFLCYKKSMNRPDLICYKPAILGRFPLEDYQTFHLPASVPLFCLPMGATIECWSRIAKQPTPVISTFVLTSDTAEKVYGAAVTFYERYPENKLSLSNKSQLDYVTDEDRKKKSLHTNKSICILSRWPFFDTFEKFLLYLYRMSHSGSHKVPLERYISHFMLDVPFPSPQRPRILIQLADDTISLAQPEDSPLPLSGASFIQLLKNLGPDNCLNVLLLALTEQKILFHSLRPNVLTSVAEAVVSLIFPFHWQCPYIPLCPLGLSDVLNAPVPFIVGVDSRYFDLYEPPHDVACVDLDTNSIYLSEDKRSLNIKILPKRPTRVLRNSLQSLWEKTHKLKSEPSGNKGSSEATPIDHDFKIKKKEHQLELEIQEAFLHFMASILKGFRSYLLPITKAPTVETTDPSSLFDLQGFLRSRDKAYHRFFVMMMKTQMFIRFIEERSFVSDKDACLAFFDECTEKVDETGVVRLLEFESQQSDRTVFIAPPEPYGLLPGIIYTYHEFGVLNPQLFHRHPEKTLLSVIAQENLTPNSPLARRTKQEIKLAQKVARKQAEIPPMWAKCLVGYCYSLWFIHLPAFTKTSSSKSKALRTAYDILVKMQSLKLHPPDEVCYRVLMLLCGLYSQPVLAVRVLFEMKRNGVQPNAITYGYYNKAVLESTWPSADSSATLMWNKLRNVVLGIAQFRQGVKKRARRSLSLCSELDYDRISRTSTESSNPEEIAMIKIHPTEFVYDLIKVDDQSSGGQSDGGYSSLNPEEAQKIASHLAAAQTSEYQMINGKSHDKDYSKSNRECSAAKSLKFEELDFSASDAFRSRVGSIVRSSASSLSNLSKLHDTIVDSSAGVLMTSHATLFEDSVFEECQSVQNERLRKRHKSDPNYRAGRAYRLRHCSCSLTQGIGENEHPRQFFRSNSFGNDVQIIRKIRNGVEINGELQDSVSKLDEKCTNKLDVLRKQDEITINTGAFGLSRCDEECEEELEAENSVLPSFAVLSRPKSPNIPIKRRNSTSDFKKSDDSLGMLNNHENCYGNYSLNNIEENMPREKDFLSTTLSPLKEAWLNWDFFAGGNLPKMASSLTYSLGLASNTNGEIKGISPMKNSKVTRSSTFHGASDNIGTRPIISKIEKTDDLLDLDYSRKTLSRSSTLPVTQKNHNSPKIAGGRNSYSGGTPSGLSRFTSRHSEILFDSLKSAANSVANKFSEFKQSFSASNTPTKGVYNSLPKPYEMEKLLLYDDDEQSCSLVEGRRASVDCVTRSSRSDDVFNSPKSEYFREPLWSKGDNNVHHVGSAPAYSSQVYEMMESHYESSSEKISSSKTALDITITSCSRCYTCYSILYDEEIMEGWSADDSNLNTQCAFCRTKLVPLLTIIVRDLRTEGSSESLLSPAHSAENILNNHLDSTSANDLNKRKISSSQNKIPTSETDFNRNNSIDSCNEAFLLFEESPESRSPASDSHSGTPLGSPTKQVSHSENYSSHVPHSLPQDVKSVHPSGADLIKLDSPGATLPMFTPNAISSVDNRYSSNSISIVKKAESWNSSTQNFLANALDDTELPTSLPSSIKSTSRLLKPLSATSSGADLRRLGISDFQTLEPITVPYLSPLVLRKEMENILEHEGDNCLTKSEFVDQHPIIYWNLVWFFKRINVPSHLPNLCLEASSITKGKQMSEISSDFKNVVIRCVWDNVKWHEDIGQPMYLLWTQNAQESSLVHALVTDERQASKNIMKQILARIQNDDLISPINLIIKQRRKCHLVKGRHHSIYRELLFLSLVALGKENIDIVCFDREYNRAFGKLTEKQVSLLNRNDRPLSPGASFCRHYFRELELITV